MQGFVTKTDHELAIALALKLERGLRELGFPPRLQTERDDFTVNTQRKDFSIHGKDSGDDDNS